MIEGCVKLGDVDTPECWSAEDDGVIDGAVGITAGGFGEVVVAGCAAGIDGVSGMPGDGVTAAAAAAAYRMGGNVGRGAGAGVGKPAFSMLAIGCCTKFGFGGGFAIKDADSMISHTTIYSVSYYLQREKTL